MKTGGFIFDVNKCVGCMACVVGCATSKSIPNDTTWRIVSRFNIFNHPALPVFNYSLACNHCEKAPCKDACPSKAYHRDEVTGAIIHDQTKCIGCKYCTWVCPYDAPKYNDSTCTVEKCNFCVDLLKEGSKPSCVFACPTGALSYGNHEGETDKILSTSKPHQAVKPRLKVIQSLGPKGQPQIMNKDYTASPNNDLLIKPSLNKKISAFKEWPLVIFSLLTPMLISWLSSSVTHQVKISSFSFLVSAFFAAGISTLHLGKRTRSWRAIMNMRSSWLSREIASYAVFVALAGLYFLTGSQVVGYITIAVSAVFLLALDSIYSSVRPDKELKLHSSSVMLTAFFWWSILTGFLPMALLVGLIKILLYTIRVSRQSVSFKLGVVKYSRVFLLLIALSSLYFYPTVPLIAMILAFCAEVIDRLQFYDESRVITPETLFDKMMTNYLGGNK